jgi:hypothetical protein
MIQNGSKQLLVIGFLVCCALWLGACGDDASTGTKDVDTTAGDGDTDTDTDADSDGDTDSDSDTDTDTDADADTDPDSGEDTALSPCSYVCVPEGTCESFNGVVQSDATCRNDGDECCIPFGTDTEVDTDTDTDTENIDKQCAFVCTLQQACTGAIVEGNCPSGGPGGGLVCCDMDSVDTDTSVSQTCEYACLSFQQCTELGGVINLQETCADHRTSCCEPSSN